MCVSANISCLSASLPISTRRHTHTHTHTVEFSKLIHSVIKLCECVCTAISVLSSLDCAERDEGLAAFHKAANNDPLVINKWFTLQVCECVCCVCMCVCVCVHLSLYTHPARTGHLGSISVACVYLCVCLCVCVCV